VVGSAVGNRVELRGNLSGSAEVWIGSDRSPKLRVPKNSRADSVEREASRAETTESNRALADAVDEEGLEGG
jgi:hypothetical protein